MNVGACACGIFVVPFLLVGILFGTFKEKAAKFVSGFNSLPEEERNRYDKTHISRDMRNQCFAWALIMFAGAVLSYMVTAYMAVLAFMVWLIMFFRNVHMDAHTAFKKYLIKSDEI